MAQLTEVGEVARLSRRYGEQSEKRKRKKIKI
jgi:hypothetical protein